MKIVRVRWDSFQVPFKRDFGTSQGVTQIREGLILRLTTDSGMTGVGEASPLPLFGGGTVDDAARALARIAPWLVGRTIDEIERSVQALDRRLPGVPAVSCAVDVALGDVLSREQGISLARWLSPAAADVVPVNATIAAREDVQAVQQVEDAVRLGFGTLKLKVGMAQTLAAEVERVVRVREAMGRSVRLRLDANGGWTPERAVQVIHAVECYDVELIEQPVPAHDVAGLAQVRRAVSIPIAADEAVADEAGARSLLDADAADVFIVKPMIVGGLRSARRICELARVAKRGVVVTTTIDGGIGVIAALHLAATLPRPILPCGLATASLLETDLLVQSPVAQQGTMIVPRGPGLGVVVDESELARRAGTIRGELTA